MKTVLVTPVNTFGVKAPSIATSIQRDVNKEVTRKQATEAIAEAKTLSRLADFPNTWSFKVKGFNI